MTVKAASGRYPIERRQGEIERLHTQGAPMMPECAIMLERIGLAAGAVCLDLGCGPGGITSLLSERVGKTGRVVGLDADPVFLEHARRHSAPNVEFVAGDAYASQLPARTFDLVHSRFVASTAGNPEALLAEAKRLARPDGTVALQEPDMATLACYPPHPAWARLKSALIGAFESVGSDISLGRRLFAVARSAGLADVHYRPFLLGFRSSDPMADYLPSVVESLRAAILRAGLMTEHDLESALADCRAHLSNAGVVSTLYTVVQVWGRVEP
jgi:SAM-dependent methyltransferase